MLALFFFKGFSQFNKNFNSSTARRSMLDAAGDTTKEVLQSLIVPAFKGLSHQHGRTRKLHKQPCKAARTASARGRHRAWVSVPAPPGPCGAGLLAAVSHFGSPQYFLPECAFLHIHSFFYCASRL